MKKIFLLILLTIGVFGYDSASFERALFLNSSILENLSNNPSLSSELKKNINNIKDNDTKKAVIASLKLSFLVPLKIQREFWLSAWNSFKAGKLTRSQGFSEILKEPKNAYPKELRDFIPNDDIVNLYKSIINLDSRLKIVALREQKTEKMAIYIK